MIVELARRGFIKFGNFKLSSGLESPFYVDLRGVLGEPDLLRWVISQYISILARVEFDVVAGVAMGSIPYGSILGYLLGKPIAYARPEAKGHGLGRQVEGADVANKKVVVVDDVLTTGSSIEGAINAIKNAGGFVVSAVVFLDREQCGSSRIESKGVKVLSVYKMRQVLEELRDFVSEEQRRAVLEYLAQWRC